MSLDLATSKFWVVLLMAWLVCTPLTKKQHKVKCLAILNLLFIGWLVSPWATLAVGLAIGLLVRGVSILKKPDSRLPVVLALSLVCLSLFFVVNIPQITAALTVPGFRNVLFALGFSYIFLRVIELVRFVYEDPEQAPDWFQAVSYLVPFHMLAAGPIQRYSEYKKAITVMPLTKEDTLVGLERISTGLFKKFVLADVIARVWLTNFQHPDPGYLFLELQLNYVWLFLDFSGYSDIAVGAGRLLGFKTPENFNNPFLAPNLVDLWERWHITLSKFIKFNIFLPLQFWLARKVDGRWPLWIGGFSFLVSFTLCGLWHSFSWIYLYWGALHGFGLGACKAYQAWAYRKFGKKRLKKSRILRVVSTILTFEFVALSWMLVSAPQGTFSRIANMF